MNRTQDFKQRVKEMADKMEERTVENTVSSTTVSSSWVPAIFRSSKNETTSSELTATSDAKFQADTSHDRDDVLSIASSSDSEYDPVQHPAVPQNSENGDAPSSHDSFQNIDNCEVENSRFRSQIEIHSNELLRILDECTTPMTSLEERNMHAQLQEESRKIGLMFGDDIVRLRSTLQVS